MGKNNQPEDGLLPTDYYPPIKINRPMDNDERAEKYLYLLIRLTKDRIRQRANAVIPPEATDFIGPQRAAINEKMRAIMDLGNRIQDARHETDNRESLNQVIKDLVTFSSHPGVSMALISRLWKYLDDNAKKPFKKDDKSLYPTDFVFKLGDYILEKGHQPLTWDEEKELCEAVKEWKDKKKTTEAILKAVDSAISLARAAASFPTEGSREYAKNAMINRAWRDERVQKLLAIRKYLEDLFAKEAEAI